MKHLIALTLLFLCAPPALALEIPAAAEIAPGLFRGPEPRQRVALLAQAGIDEVIIFKRPTRNEVERELQALRELGIAAHLIEFRWKELESPQVACAQVIEALALIARAQRRGKSLYFHCTVGEDRTGLLAGLWRMQHEGLGLEEAWDEELCARGYADGNPKKPATVVRAIHQELTPLFEALARKVVAGEKLNLKSCESLELRPTRRRCSGR